MRAGTNNHHPQQCPVAASIGTLPGVCVSCGYRLGHPLNQPHHTAYQHRYDHQLPHVDGYRMCEGHAAGIPPLPGPDRIEKVREKVPHADVLTYAHWRRYAGRGAIVGVHMGQH